MAAPSVPSPIPVSDITGLVLAGGMGSRMGGVDKGLQFYRGRPLAAWAVEILRPQVGALFLSANRHLDEYAAFGVPVLSDRFPGFAGPLAGVHAALARLETPWLATCPCDSPHLPPDLARRLAERLRGNDAPIAVARAAGRIQPVFMLCRGDVLPNLEAYLAAGGRRIGAWQAELGAIPVDFDDRREAFKNFNTLADLEAGQEP